MKIKKFNEEYINKITSDLDLELHIYEIMSVYLDTYTPKFTDDTEIDEKSVKLASEMIVSELKKLGIDFDTIYSANKFNI